MQFGGSNRVVWYLSDINVINTNLDSPISFTYWWWFSLCPVLLLQPHGMGTYQAPISMGFSREECWSGLPFPSPGDLPNPRIEPRSPALQPDSLPTELQRKPPLLILLL